MTQFKEQSGILHDAITAEAGTKIENGRLVSIEFEPVSDVTDGAPKTSVRVLKSSARLCFVQGQLFLDDTLVMTARGIFKVM